MESLCIANGHSVKCAATIAPAFYLAMVPTTLGLLYYEEYYGENSSFFKDKTGEEI